MEKKFIIGLWEIINFSVGSKYIGKWKNDKKEEFEFYFFSYRVIYDKEWKYDNKESYERTHFPNGEKNKGIFKEDIKDI